jgi:hypothetical protein
LRVTPQKQQSDQQQEEADKRPGLDPRSIRDQGYLGGRTKNWFNR